MNFRPPATVPPRHSWCRLILLGVFLTPCLQAAPAWQNELSSPAPGPFPRLAPTALELRVSWQGAIDAGTIRVEFAPPDVAKPGTLIVRSSATSQGAAAVLFPYRTHFWAELDPATFRPRLFHALEIDAKESLDTTVRFSPTQVTIREIQKPFETGKTRQSDRSFGLAPVFDLFSAMLYVRSQKLVAGDKLALVVHPFGTPYLLRVQVQDREVHNGRNAIRLSLGLRKIDRETLELRPYKKLKRDATLWLSDDAERIPLEFRAAVFIGDVRATLTAHRKP